MLEKLDAFNQWLPDYSNLTPNLVLVYFIAGVFGALVRVAWLDKPIRGLYRDSDGFLRMGFYAEVIVAVAVAISIDGHAVRAGIAAIFAPFLLNAVRTFLEEKLPSIIEIILIKKTTGPDDDDGQAGNDG